MKLVRDRIPDIIRESGSTPDCSRVTGELKRHMLSRKLLEELEEFMQDPCPEEAGDMLEVCRALFMHHGIAMAEVAEAANKKKMVRGGFGSGWVLHGTVGS